MFRKSSVALATNIPRHVWDPKRANPNWTDSYAADVADRRHWPAKKWSVGLEPRTPKDWLQFSMRNLAYAYNGALRACSSFPEMVGLYQEMKQRDVAVDLDTMNALLTRAARFDRIEAQDVFSLFHEMISLGARADISVVETLHTVFDHHSSNATSVTPEWSLARRGELVELYNNLCAEDIGKYGGKDLPHLLRAQVKRYRDNLRALDACLNPSVVRQYIAQVDDADTLLAVLHDFLWDCVKPDHECVHIRALDVYIPRIHLLLRRPDSTVTNPTQNLFEDLNACNVFLAAVERTIDTRLESRRFATDRVLLLALMNCFWQSGVMLSSDVLAQVMDVVKFSQEDAHRDADAMRYFTYGMRVSSVHDDAAKAAWNMAASVVDGRVVGRFIAARDPWSSRSFTFNRNTWSFDLANLGHVTSPAAEPTSVALVVSPADPQRTVTYTADHLLTRWQEIDALIASTGALEENPSIPASHMVEVFTGKAIFISNVLYGTRGANSDAAGSGKVGGSKRQMSQHLRPEMSTVLLQMLRETKQQLDVFCNTQQITHGVVVEPELECFEGLLLATRGLLDYLLLTARGTDGANGGMTEHQTTFNGTAELRRQLLSEARDRFGGRFRIFWLQES